MKTIFVTGFEPFDLDFLRFRSVAGFWVVVASLKSEIPNYDRGKKILESARHIKASGVISFGVGSERSGSCIEEIAVNHLNGEGVRVNDSYPYGHEVAMNLVPWRINNLPSGNFFEYSRDPGNSYANHFMYQVRASQLGGLEEDLPFLFVHLPPTTPAVPEKEVTELIEVILDLAEL